MANLDPNLTQRLRAAVRAEGLRFRNWSIPGEWMFSIYTLDDSYVGCVQLHVESQSLRLDQPSKVCKRERLILESLCRTFAREAA